jgi:membrane protein implicated in regulation of membrane protease activity
LTWLVAARIAGLFWSPPQGPTIAFLTAIVAGTVVAIVAGRRLARKLGAHEEVRET